MKKTIFYSWQSDLPKETNLNGIKISLREACNFIEEKIEDITIELDEATRNTSGSPNIPKTIFKKISDCDIFICDLSTINKDSKEELRRVQNPNVLIELGYAIATIGWERIIMLFNVNFGTFPNDLPFDIDRHRATSYSIKDKDDKIGKKQLSEVMKVAIRTIVEKSPLKPHEKKSVNPIDRKRQLDIDNLRRILSTINVATFDAFVEEVPDYVIYDFLYYYEGFSALYKSNTFHIYNLELFDLIKKVFDNLEILMSLKFAHHYFMPPNSRKSKFTYPNDEKGHNLAIKDYAILLNNSKQLKDNFSTLIKYLRKNYLEINLEETSKIAFNDYLTYHSK